MSNVGIKDAADATRKIDTFQRTEGADTVETQAVVIIDSSGAQVIGSPADASATDDTGTFSLISLIKRALEQITRLVSPVRQRGETGYGSDYGQVMFGQRNDYDSVDTSNNGQYSSLKQDEFGRLKVAAQPPVFMSGVGSINNAGGSVAIEVAGAALVVVSMSGASLVGHNAVFEFSNDTTDGTDGTWFQTRVARTDSNTVETSTGVLNASPAYAWSFNVAAYKYIRIRATAHASGVATYFFKPSGYASDPIASSQPAATQTFSATVTGAIDTATPLIVVDCLNLRSLMVQLVSIGSGGAVIAQLSNNGSIWDDAFLSRPSGEAVNFPVQTQVSYSWAVAARYFRLIPTTPVVSGTTDVLIYGSLQPAPVQATQAVRGSVTVENLPAVQVVAQGYDSKDFWPQYTGTGESNQRPSIDPGGNLLVRGAVTTDEGTFRANFANTSLAVSVGNVSVAGSVVTGTGFLASDIHYKDYFKLNADAESAWTAIESIDSDTQLTLRADYVGGTSGAASRALMRPVTGSGGSISVASGQVTLTTGTTTNAITRITRDVDYAPMVYRGRLSISQRIVNQTFRIGLSESFTTADRWFSRFKVDGTTNTTVICETGRNPTTTPSAAETESTTVTLPGGATTAALNDYRVEMLTEKVAFFINGVLVATHTRSIPAQYDQMEASVTCINGAVAPATTTTVTVDYVTGKNHNKLEVGIMSDAEQIVAVAAPLVSYAYSLAGVIAINTDLLVLDCLQLRSLFIQCASMGTTGVVTVQWCNEPTFTTPITATLLSESGAASTTFNAAVLRVTNVLARYCRLRLTTATTAGTTTINVWGSQSAYVPIVTTQPVSGTVGVTGDTAAAASADALANPTIKQIGADLMNFNGATWDRQRNNANVVMGDTGAKVASFFGATQTNYNARGAKIMVLCGTVTGTTPTLTAQLQVSPDGGTTWLNVGAASGTVTATGNTILIDVYPTNESTAGATPAALTTSATQTLQINTVLPRTWRISYTITGTTPSFTLTNAYAAYTN